MRFAEPWLLLLVLPLGALALYLSRQRPVVSLRDLVALLLRWAAGLLVVLALAQPQLTHGSDRPTMLVIDRSASIDGAAGRDEQSWLDKARDVDPVARGIRRSLHSRPSGHGLQKITTVHNHSPFVYHSSRSAS